MRMLLPAIAVILLAAAPSAAVAQRPADTPALAARFVLPPQTLHVHSSSIVELPGGDLWAVWYRGSGERRADDVRIEGARFDSTTGTWSAPVLVADTPGFPDCNPVTFIDGLSRLLVVWPVIVDNRWESAVLRYRAAPAAGWTGAEPAWNDGGIILLRPDDLAGKMGPFAQEVLATLPPGRDRDEVSLVVGRLTDKLYNRLGWMPRTRPLRLPSGRLLLPLYSDTYNVGLIAISDDAGATWRASDPIVSLGGVQPSLVRRTDGSIVAWMRDNGPPPQRAIVAVSRDDGLTWSKGDDSDVPNPGSSLEVVTLRDGSWLMVLNDTEEGRSRLSVWRSHDEGRTWPIRRPLEDSAVGSYSYPSMLQGSDGRVHVTYSHVEAAVAGGPRLEAIRHVTFDLAWLTGTQASPPARR